VRTAEWRSAREFAVTATRRAGPAALAITGEAGAGKSNLWRAAVAEAAGCGCRVLRSEPSASEADTPFAGLSDLLAGVVPLVASGIPEPQRAALGVALLSRPASEQLPAGEEPPAAHAIGRGVLAVLNALVSAGPVFLAVDDVQWLDAGSMDALVFALRRIASVPPSGPAGARPSLSLLLAARTEAPADPLTIGTPSPPDGWRRLLAAFPAPEELPLEPLALDQVQNLLPATATVAQARLVATQSRGNPFWAREIWSSIATTTAPAAISPAGEAPVPPRARAALAGRLKRSLSPPAAEALAVVAAAGRISVPDALATMEDVADSAAAIDSAVVAGVVIETEGRLAPAHPLIGATAVEAVPPDRRATLYRRLAAVSASTERRAQFTALAAAAQGTMPDEAVARALDAAAEAAASKTAYVAAGKFAAQAVRFTPPGDAATLVRRRIRAGELLDSAGEFTEALRHFDDLDLDALTTAEAERVLPRLADLLEFLHGQAAATTLITRSLASAGDDDRRQALLLSLASDTWYGVPGGRRDAAIAAIARAETAGSDANASLHRALVNLVAAKVSGGESVDEALLGRAERLERIVPGIPMYEVADAFRNWWYQYTEKLDIARAALLRLVSRARDTGDDWALSLFLAQLALTEELNGDYVTAELALTEAESVAATYDWPKGATVIEPRCGMLIASGNLEEAHQLADEHLPDEPDRPLAGRFLGACLRGKINAWRGNPTAAVRCFQLAAAYADELDWVDPGQRSWIDPALAYAYVETGEPARAAEISAWLRDLGTRMNRPTLVGDACRIDALIAAGGEGPDALDAAAEYAQAAVAAHERSQLRIELARSLLVLGHIERRLKARTEARAALRRAHDLAATIGHQPLIAQINAELPTSALPRAETMLTAAEQRVAEQIAKGSTNREAAAELFLSVRTVETHVASIYRKLGVRTRSDLRRTLTARAVETPLPVED
jgi:DNA-binding CsgD family transcriptional regulator